MRRHLYLIALLLTCIQMTSFAQSERMKYNFNLDWKLFAGDDSTARNVGYADKTWKSISLPYAFNEKEAFSVPISQHTGRVVWYRKTFVLPANLKNKKVFIEFEGSRQAAEVWVNGKWVGLHEDGVMQQRLSVENEMPEISVKVDRDKLSALGLTLDNVGLTMPSR